MPYRSNKTQTLAGHDLGRGDLIPADVVAAIPPHRWGSLVRVGLVFEDLTVPAPPPAVVGEMCPICGEGPFARLARHTTAKHESATMDGGSGEPEPNYETEDINNGDSEALPA